MDCRVAFAPRNDEKAVIASRRETILLRRHCEPQQNNSATSSLRAAGEAIHVYGLPRSLRGLLAKCFYKTVL